jgi:RNA polymerase sigma-70 factor (ECF subfamily)
MEDGREFPQTSWGMVCGVREPGAKERRVALDTLCQRYRGPICSYARAAWAKNDADAEDLTQDFFLWILDENEVLSRFTPELGSFRNFLKGILRNFGRNAKQAARAEKRGGGKALLSLDDAAQVGDARFQPAEEAFDQAWVLEVTNRAVDRVRKQLAGSRSWRVFEAYDLASAGERPTYGTVAREHDMKESDVRNALFAVREKLRSEIRAELCDTVATQRDLDEEWRRVVGA